MEKALSFLVRAIQVFKKYAGYAVIGFTLGIVLVAPLTLRRGNDEVSYNNDSDSRADTKQIGSADPSAEGNFAGLPQKGEAGTLIQEEAGQSGLFTVLLVGMDNRPEEKQMGNTDCLIVASLDQERKKIVLLSVPRDSQVSLPGRPKEKINAVGRLEQGVYSTKAYLEEMIGTKINAYVLTNFRGFKEIIDALGGITLTVEKNMLFDTGDKEDRLINLKKGTQHLNGAQALQYARFRNDELADISRTERQQRVVKAILSEAVDPRNWTRLPILLPKAYQAIQTDLNVSQIWELAQALQRREDYEIVMQTLPGSFTTEDGVSYWKVNSALAKQVVSKMLNGEKVGVFSNANYNGGRSDEAISENKARKQQPEKPETEATNKTSNNTDQITFEIVEP